MSDQGESPRTDGGARSLRSREVLLVTLAALALVVAAFAVPPLASAADDRGGDEERSPSDPTATPTPTQTPDDGPRNEDRPGSREGEPGGPQSGGGEDVRVTAGNATGGDGPVVNQSKTVPHSDCFVVVWDRVVPGRTLTIVRWRDGAAVRDRRVWLDGDLVGRTDDAGRVDGRTPYVRQLTVTAAVGDVERCYLVPLEMETGYDEWRRNHGPPRILIDDESGLQRLVASEGTVSGTLPVRGTASVTVEGEPYPGDAVRVNATIDGEPMRNATVAVDGQRVGRTDDAGQFDLRIPETGADELTVAVSRGAFGARTTVDVLRLSIAVRPTGPLAIPGGSATVVAGLGDESAGVVPVSVDGERVTTTGADGRARIDLPADPGATVSVAGHEQTARTSLWPVYAPTIVVAVLLLGAIGASLGWSARRASGRTSRVVAASWTGLAVLAAAGLLAGRRGVLAVLAGAAVLGALLAGLVYRDDVRAWVASAGSVLQATVYGILRLAMGLADWLGWLADASLRWLGGLAARLAGTPRSMRAVLELLAGRLVGLPGSALSGARRLWRATRRELRLTWTALVSVRGLLVAGCGTVAVAAGYLVGEETGAAVSGLAVLAAIVLGWAYRAGSADRSPDAAEEATGRPTSRDAARDDASGASRVSLHALWRTFARWVVPGRVRSRSPGEVARAAVDRGFPREPVEGLTEAFREVEYGDRPVSEERWGRARAAFDALRAARGDEEAGER